MTYRHRVHAWLKVCAVRMSYLALSILMFHPSSLLFPSAPSSSNCARPRKRGSSALPHERRGVWLPGRSDALHRERCSKEFDKTTSVDGDTTPINDPNHDGISDFSKTTRENTGLFGVPTVFETSVSHVSHGNFVFQRESKENTPRETIAREREKKKERREKVL